MRFNHKKRHYKKPEPPRQTYWLVNDPADGESMRVYSVTEQHLANELNKPNTRLFNPETDSRGPAVKFIATYGVRDAVWYPETEGYYFIAFTTPDMPEDLKKYRLHFGSVSTPQRTKAAIHSIYLELLKDWPKAIIPYLCCVKMPCVFCKDHPDVPGGSSVPVPLDSLPPPDKKKVAQVFM